MFKKDTIYYNKEQFCLIPLPFYVGDRYKLLYFKEGTKFLFLKIETKKIQKDTHSVIYFLCLDDNKVYWNGLKNYSQGESREYFYNFYCREKFGILK